MEKAPETSYFFLHSLSSVNILRNAASWMRLSWKQQTHPKFRNMLPGPAAHIWLPKMKKHAQGGDTQPHHPSWMAMKSPQQHKGSSWLFPLTLPSCKPQLPRTQSIPGSTQVPQWALER